MTKLSDLYYAGGANAIAQPVVQGEYQTYLLTAQGTIGSASALYDSFTVNTTGSYIAHVHVTIDNASSNTSEVRFMEFSLKKNSGATTITDGFCQVVNAAAAGADYGNFAGQGEIELTAGDTVELWFSTNNGGAFQVNRGKVILIPKVLNSVTTTMTDAELAGRILPTAMDDATATRLGKKIYTQAEVTVTITANNGGGTGETMDYLTAIPYQMQDGSWRMKFNIDHLMNGDVVNDFSITWTGVTFASSGGQGQAVLCTYDSGSVAVTASAAQPNVSTMKFEAGGNGSKFAISGDVALASKPSWAS